MDFAFSERAEALHQRMRALGPHADMAQLARAGALGLTLSEACGGGGHSAVDAGYGFEGLGYGGTDAGLLLAAGAHLFGVAMTLERHGGEALAKTWLPALASGEVMATVGATEREAGSDIGAVATSIEPAAGGFRVRGDKRYVTWADRAGLFLVLGRHPDKGLTCVLVPEDGVRAARPYDVPRLAGARLAAVTLDAIVPPQNIVGRLGAGMSVFQAAMTHERALVLAFRLGAMRRQLETAVRFARTRRVAGTPIIKHQAVARRLAEMQARLEGARLLTYRAAWRIDTGSRRAVGEAALAKWQLAEAAVANALDAFRIGGGAAFTDDTTALSALEEALGGTVHSGTQDVLAHIVATWLEG